VKRSTTADYAPTLAPWRNRGPCYDNQEAFDAEMRGLAPRIRNLLVRSAWHGDAECYPTKEALRATPDHALLALYGCGLGTLVALRAFLAAQE
jgi:hypothetical protein